MKTKEFTVPMTIYGYAQVKAKTKKEALKIAGAMIYPHRWMEINELGEHIDFRVNNTETYDNQIEEI